MADQAGALSPPIMPPPEITLCPLLSKIAGKPVDIVIGDTELISLHLFDYPYHLHDGALSSAISQYALIHGSPDRKKSCTKGSQASFTRQRLKSVFFKTFFKRIRFHRF